MTVRHPIFSAGAAVLVSRSLPDGGLAALLERPMSPLVNAVGTYAPPTDAVVRLPLEAVVMAPNSAAFLASLGKPLAIARNLESAPGVWHLGTADGWHEWVVFSDCHRKNSWKGGQVCAIGRHRYGPPSPASISRLCEAMATVWGAPTRPPPPGDFPEGPWNQHWLDWFELQAQQRGAAPPWPAAAGFAGRPPTGLAGKKKPRGPA